MLRKVTAYSCIAALLCTLAVAPAQAEKPQSQPPFQEQTQNQQGAPELSKEQMLTLLDTFVKDRAEQEERLYNVRKLLYIKAMDIKEIPVAFVKTFKDLRRFETAGKPFKTTDAIVDMKVNRESKFRLNGLNYRLVIFQYDNGKWQVVDYDMIPVDRVVAEKLGFGTDDERRMAEIFRKRAQGVYVNRKGEVVDKENAATPEDLKAEMNGTPPSNVPRAKWQAFIPDQINPYYKRPKWIKVIMTTKENKQAYGCTEDCVKEVDFMEYLQKTFPFLWTQDAPPESLKAGALAVKMLAWYSVVADPITRRLEADVEDTSLPFHANYQPKNAVEKAKIERLQKIFYADGVAGVGFKDGLSHNLISSEITTANENKQSIGTLSIPGADQMAGKGQDAADILQFYYEGSKKLEEGAALTFFRYATN